MIGERVQVKFLDDERRTLESYLPGFDERLAGIPLNELEAPESEVVELFRDAGGPGLLIPSELSGAGAAPVDAIRVQRAIGARSPSLAAGITMHHFSVAALVETWKVEHGDEGILLTAIANENMLLASGFAEGKHGQGVMSPTMRARRHDGQVVISGVKKPCSLSRSMNFLTASVVIEAEAPDGDETFGMAIIPADVPGIEVSPFWDSPVLAGAQSDAVTLTDVTIPVELLIPVEEPDEDGEPPVIETGALLWFQLLITASYLGMASALVERVLDKAEGDAWPAVAAAAELEAAMSSLEGVARRMEADRISSALLTRALLCRSAATDAITRAVASAVEQLGGMSFIRGQDVSYLATASRALAFHPPGRLRAAGPLAASLRGEPLIIS